jgi:hypothetical protein
MPNTKGYITHELGNDEAWVCACKNTPSDDGLYPCDEKGNEVEPTPKEWTTNPYVCHRCGRIIDLDTLEVVGRNNALRTVLT